MSSVKGVAGRLLIGLSLMATAALASGCSEQESKAESVVRPVKVIEVAASEKGRRLEYSGAVKARYAINLAFRVNGKITERPVDIGDRVRPGDILARLDAADYELAVTRAEADLRSATKQVGTLRLFKERAETLYAKNAASKSELDQRTLAYDQALSTEQSAISALEQAKNQVAYTKLHADMAGIVTAVNGEPGQVVGSGTPVVTIAMDGEKEVQVAVPETDIANFAAGAAVKVRFWSQQGTVLDGTVREVAGSADPRSRTFSVRVRIPDDQRVLLGMTATVEARVGGGPAGFDIPLSALAERDGGPVVWLVDRDAGTVRPRSVRLGEFSDDGVMVNEGLSPGDMVVSAGTQFMSDGLKVKVSAADAQQTAVNAAPAAAVAR
ncbi:efflux RND transporter periplasmic adaptor subunit [Ciceribacter thiooxidans]|uniref:Efflux RND transporter periplasmic adaptor subunit n=1 Tax=Ciceribacter thiooxidans TaxID=1969821 RepID=A0ABV7HUI9_9HYPH|nr:efflux RND transporter periplasmic adaptor subunit [Ciceribacter thiooxidans]